MSQKQNVLLIVVDQWRGDTLGVLGHPCIRTPHLDALCADGVTFRRHFTQAAPCGPGRASLLTGLYMMNHRVVQNSVPMDARHTNLALEMRQGGYEPDYTRVDNDKALSTALDHHDWDLVIADYTMPGFSGTAALATASGSASRAASGETCRASATASVNPPMNTPRRRNAARSSSGNSS